MNYTLYVGSLSFGLFIGILLFQEIGRRLGLRWLATHPEQTKAGFGAIEGAVLALLGLLLAFTFSGAAARLDARRQLIVEETNAISSAYLRLDLLPGPVRASLREDFRRYVDARLSMYRKLPDVEAAKQEYSAATKLQQDIWRQAVSAVRSDNVSPQTVTVLLPALSAMMDVATTRAMAAWIHPPAIIFVMLFALALASALLGGWGMAGGHLRSWLHMLCFAVVIAVTVYVILDLEQPRLGLIRADAFDQLLMALRESMK
jgi:hypothetical protein